MTIIIILLAFFCDKYQGLLKIKHYAWINSYAEGMLRLLPYTKSAAPWWGFICIISPVLIIILLFQLVMHTIWCGLAGFIFSVFILYYCLGSSRMSDYLLAILSKQTSQPIVVDAEAVNMTTPDSAEIRAIKFMKMTHQEIFAIIFWFILLGAVGAALYRILLVLKTYAEKNTSSLHLYLPYFQFCLEVLNWPSVRLLSLCLSLGGAFTRVFPIWCQGLLGGLSENQQLLADCTLAATETNAPEAIELLFYRALIICLVVLALMTLASVIS